MQSAPKQDTSRKHLSAVPGAGLSAAVCGFCLSKSGFMIFLRRKSFTADPYTEIFQHGCPHSLCKNPWSRSLVDTSPGGVALQIFQHVCPHSLCRNPCSRSLVDTSSAGVVLQILQARLPTQSLQKPLFPQSCRHVLCRRRPANFVSTAAHTVFAEPPVPQVLSTRPLAVSRCKFASTAVHTVFARNPVPAGLSKGAVPASCWDGT